jgi:hypothetical protein
MDLPDPTARTVVTPPAQAGRRQGRLLRLLAAGCLVSILLGAVPLANWAANDDRLAEVISVQWVTTAMKNATESLGLAEPYAWIRQQARALQHLRFGPTED